MVGCQLIVLSIAIIINLYVANKLHWWIVASCYFKRRQPKETYEREQKLLIQVITRIVPFERHRKFKQRISIFKAPLWIVVFE